MPNKGGTHDQHIRAGQQSHKSDPKNKPEQQMSGDKDHHRGGKGNFAEDRERATEAGRKDGKA